VLLVRFAASLSRDSIANSTLAHSSGTPRGNALQNKQSRAQQKKLARDSSTARGNALDHHRQQPRAQKKSSRTAAAPHKETR
jgi:hypothetical protein